MHGERVYFSEQNLNQEPPALLQGTNTHFQASFKTFLHNFTRDNTRVYHHILAFQIQKRRPVLPLDLSDLRAYDEHLYERFISTPMDTLKIMEQAVYGYLKEKRQEFPDARDDNWQVAVRSSENARKLRQIDSSLVARLFVVGGIIISATKPYIKASKLKLRCRNCLGTKVVELAPGQFPFIPSFCQGQQNMTGSKCPNDPFIAMPDSEVIDTQSLRLQENPEDVPTGEIARTYNLVVDRENVGKCVPGDRVKMTGIMFVQETKADQLSRGYIYVTGIQKVRERSSLQYTEQEEGIFKDMSKNPKIYDMINRSIAPGIYGNEEVKKAIACMLFGGSRKHLPDQTLLRGDINILLIGDPSTAKSQFLKFVEQTASIAVYTSGKGSSAAGLTASINKDPATGEFQIEGGALVLADGGIVCIDEFDKMKPGDRVAIHEAMEQQTISVAKAGITTRLNSRCSILAAANPIFGRYDDMQQISDQIQLQTTILSRFDCIFVVRDVNTRENNERIASHILDLHQGRSHRQDQGELPFQILKKYVKYAKAKVSPRLSVSACDRLQNLYIADRKKALEHRMLTHAKSSIPITVRQLEAIIRLSQSLARMKLKVEVGTQEVDQAHYLFELSTLKSIEGKEFGLEVGQDIGEEVFKIEDAIRKRVCIGNQVPTNKLVSQMQERFNERGVIQAIRNMVQSGEFREIKFKKQLMREK